jgi:hypothetical protein
MGDSRSCNLDRELADIELEHGVLGGRELPSSGEVNWR